MYPENKAFSPELPTFQLAWDSTSYKTFKECPFKYYLSIVLGYQPRARSPHLAFGIAFHAAVEHFHRLRAQGVEVQEAINSALGAAYYRQLRTHAEKVAGEGYHEHSVPDGHSAKSAKTLLRTILWYLDQFADDPAKTHILADGQPAVELSFSFPVDDELSYCGHFDRIVEYNDHLFVTDYKTTTSQLNAQYFSQYSPDIQMTGYTLASQIVFAVPAKGVLVDAAQIQVTGSSFARQPVNRTGAQLEEFLADFRLDVEIARIYAERESWPQNPQACHHYGGCVFRKVCSHSPAVRQNFLTADFKLRTWDPTKER